MTKHNPIELQCRSCGYAFTEYVELPMKAEAFIARGKAWLCPQCGSKKVDMVGGVFMEKPK